jgi:hypothetical protein
VVVPLSVCAVAVAVVRGREGRAGDAGETVLRVEGERGACVSRRIARAVEREAGIGELVVHIKAVRLAGSRKRKARVVEGRIVPERVRVDVVVRAAAGAGERTV